MNSIEGLTIDQAKAVAAATKLAPHPWHDGIIREITARLDGDPPWPNATVQSAIISALAVFGVDTPILV